MKNKMILGTVQLGTNYGVNNVSGKPTEQEVFDILDYAFKNGVRMLDTASAYGDSEKLIGIYIENTKNKFEICTKLPVDIEPNNMVQYYEKSVKKLNVQSLNVLYLHRFEQCKNPEILNRLITLKQAGKVQNIGVSIYAPNELGYVVNNLKGIINVVQLPFNLFDTNRWMGNNLLAQAWKADIKIFARSIYLQGLIFVEPECEKAKKLNISSQLLELRMLSEKNNCSISRLAVSYVNSVDYISNYLIGCETLEQLKTNIEITNHPVSISVDFKDKIIDIGKTIVSAAIDPRRWNE